MSKKELLQKKQSAGDLAGAISDILRDAINYRFKSAGAYYGFNEGPVPGSFSLPVLQSNLELFSDSEINLIIWSLQANGFNARGMKAGRGHYRGVKAALRRLYSFLEEK